jgi:predicted DNA binding CopG/RHH family protein
MLENIQPKPTRKNAKGQGRKPQPKKIRIAKIQASKKKYASKKKSLTIMFDLDIFDSLKTAKLEANMSYQELISTMLKERSKTALK